MDRKIYQIYNLIFQERRLGYEIGAELSGYNLDAAKNIRLSFKIDGSGSGTGLTVHNPKQDLSARRNNKRQATFF